MTKVTAAATSSPALRGKMAHDVKRKQSLYFPEEMLEEIKAEATRQDRSLSWIVQRAWRVAREEIRQKPSATDALQD